MDVELPGTHKVESDNGVKIGRIFFCRSRASRFTVLGFAFMQGRAGAAVGSAGAAVKRFLIAHRPGALLRLGPVPPSQTKMQRQ